MEKDDCVGLLCFAIAILGIIKPYNCTNNAAIKVYRNKSMQKINCETRCRAKLKDN